MIRLALIAIFLPMFVATAQESPTPTPTLPSPSPRSVRISFLPPPLEGAISLGIYDTKGKLVRVLHREADIEDFEIGSDALSTTWDGRNDAGEDLPSGKYHARGYVVGELLVEGIGFFFNDWVTDEDSPHLRKVRNLRLVSENELALLVTLASGKECSATYDLSAASLSTSATEGEDERFLPDRDSVRAAEGKLSFRRADGWETVSWPDLVAPQSAAAGKDATVWVIDRTAPGSEGLALKQFSADGAFLRQMAIAAGEPAPKIVAASTVADRIFLLEENAALQRVRGLTLVATNAATAPAEKAISDWKVEFDKRIIAHQRFAIVGGRPLVGPDPASFETVTVKLRANPLEKDGSATVDLAVAYDEDGSFLKTADGLPLRTVSETSHLTRVLLSPSGDKSVDVFQDDDAVVEQFRINALDQMMAFDCGDFALK